MSHYEYGGEINDLTYVATVTKEESGSEATVFYAADLVHHGFDDDFFKDRYAVQIVKTSDGEAPVDETQWISGYDSSTGKITVSSAFTANVNTSDKFLILHESLVAIGRNDANNVFDSSAVVADENGSIIERLEHLQKWQIPDISGLFYTGTCDSTMTASTTSIVCADLNGYENDFFNNKYYMFIILNIDSAGSVPEGEYKLVTDYVSSTGTFTTDAFSANVEASDKIMVIHESLVPYPNKASGTNLAAGNTNYTPAITPCDVVFSFDIAGFAGNDDVTLTIGTGASGSETSYHKVRIRKGAAGQVTLEENTSGVQSNTDQAKIVVPIHVGSAEIIEVNRVNNAVYGGTANAYAFDESSG